MPAGTSEPAESRGERATPSSPPEGGVLVPGDRLTRGLWGRDVDVGPPARAGCQATTERMGACTGEAHMRVWCRCLADPARGAGSHSSPASLTSNLERSRGTPKDKDDFGLPPVCVPSSTSTLQDPMRNHPTSGPRRGRTEHRAPGGTRRHPWMTRPSALAHAVTRKRVTAVDPTQAGAAVRLTRHGASARPETYRPPWV